MLVTFWQTRNKNKLTKHVLSLSLRQSSNKFLKYYANAFTAKKNRCDSFGDLLAEKTQTLTLGAKLSKKIASRCDSSKNIDERKSCKSLIVRFRPNGRSCGKNNKKRSANQTRDLSEAFLCHCSMKATVNVRVRIVKMPQSARIFSTGHI